MNFKFLQIKLNTSKNEFEGKITYQDSNNGVLMYNLTKPEKNKLFGYFIKSIKLYFFKYLISVSYTLEISLEEYPDLLDCISLTTGLNPKVISVEEKSYLQWKNKQETLYCIPDYEKQVIQLYHTLNEYDIIE